MLLIFCVTLAIFLHSSTASLPHISFIGNERASYITFLRMRDFYVIFLKMREFCVTLLKMRDFMLTN